MVGRLTQGSNYVGNESKSSKQKRLFLFAHFCDRPRMSCLRPFANTAGRAFSKTEFPDSQNRGGLSIGAMFCSEIGIDSHSQGQNVDLAT